MDAPLASPRSDDALVRDGGCADLSFQNSALEACYTSLFDVGRGLSGGDGLAQVQAWQRPCQLARQFSTQRKGAWSRPRTLKLPTTAQQLYAFDSVGGRDGASGQTRKAVTRKLLCPAPHRDGD